jgi:hypothetical protein
MEKRRRRRSQSRRNFWQWSEVPVAWHYGFIALSGVILITFILSIEKFAGNITGFFRIGSVLPLSPFLDPQQVLIFKDQLGYDGQQFLSIALDPFLQNDGTIAALDHPSYRYRRILYPLLGYLFGLGNPQLIPYALVGINILAIALITVVVAFYNQSRGAEPQNSLLVLTIPGIWITLTLSTADLLGGLLTLAAIHGEHRDRPRLTALFVALALLTRETLFLIWLALFINNILLKRQRFLIPLIFSPIPALLWNGYIWLRKLPGGTGTGNFGIPGTGIIEKIQLIFKTDMTGNNLFEIYLFLLLIAGFILTLWSTYRFPSHNHTIRWGTCLYLGLFLSSSILILDYFLNYTRVFLDVYLLGLLIIHNYPFPWKNSFFAASGISSLAFLFFHS